MFTVVGLDTGILATEHYGVRRTETDRLATNRIENLGSLGQPRRRGRSVSARDTKLSGHADRRKRQSATAHPKENLETRIAPGTIMRRKSVLNRAILAAEGKPMA
jgi:hypothetical protein